MFNFIPSYIINYIEPDIIEECNICFENKKLINFCENHKFCYKCCIEWLQKNYTCPVCKNLCNNKKLMKYNFELVNKNYEDINTEILNLCFKKWHKTYCVNRKHKFFILLDKNSNNIFFTCSSCNISQYFNIST